MQMVDWAIVIVLALSVIGGLLQGFFRSVFSLAGLILGLAVAAWNYGRLAAPLLHVVRSQRAANAIAFLLIAILIMALASILGKILSKVFHQIGLGCVDRLLGAAFGFFQGALLVMLVILVAVAFFPKAGWLTEAKLPRMFFGACHLSTHMTPHELAERVRQGLKELEEESPQWMHSGNGGV
ncbi:MAG: CvpA family protein [Terracidiphilus sp.]|jgi:membrane protein required for colicin V production